MLYDNNNHDLKYLMNWVRGITANEYDEKVDEDPSMKNMIYCSDNKFIETLSKGKYDIDHQDDLGSTLLGRLLDNKMFEKVIILLKFKPDLSIRNHVGRNIYFGFHSCRRFNDDSHDMMEAVDLLISSDTNGDFIQTADHNGFTPKESYKDGIEYLMSLGNPHSYSQKIIDFYTILFDRFENHIIKTKTLFSLMLPLIE